MAMSKFDLKSLFITFIVAIFILQVGSIVVSKIVDVPVLKLGFAILLILLASALSLIVNIIFNIDYLKKETIFIFFIVVGMLVALFIFLPQLYPDIFSIMGGPGIFSVVSP
ncbi:MAG: hypothetical protein WC758_08435 [Candidatus Woesearchaeota archaeon]|jgi:hypothetical protein